MSRDTGEGQWHRASDPRDDTHATATPSPSRPTGAMTGLLPARGRQPATPQTEKPARGRSNHHLDKGSEGPRSGPGAKRRDERIAKPWQSPAPATPGWPRHQQHRQAQSRRRQTPSFFRHVEIFHPPPKRQPSHSRWMHHHCQRETISEETRMNAREPLCGEIPGTARSAHSIPGHPTNKSTAKPSSRSAQGLCSSLQVIT